MLRRVLEKEAQDTFSEQISSQDPSEVSPIQNPRIVRAPIRDPKLRTSAAQKQQTANPNVVVRYIGRFPILTASVLNNRLPTAMAAKQDPFVPVHLHQHPVSGETSGSSDRR